MLILKDFMFTRLLLLKLVMFLKEQNTLWMIKLDITLRTHLSGNKLSTSKIIKNYCLISRKDQQILYWVLLISKLILIQQPMIIMMATNQFLHYLITSKNNNNVFKLLLPEITNNSYTKFNNRMQHQLYMKQKLREIWARVTISNNLMAWFIHKALNKFNFRNSYMNIWILK
jgi:hypothetical protein